MENLGIIVLVVLAILLALIIYGTIAKNRWGINLKRVSCPKCGTEASRLRVPASGSEVLWGGYTCPNCGCQMDKWGRQRTT